VSLWPAGMIGDDNVRFLVPKDDTIARKLHFYMALHSSTFMHWFFMHIRCNANIDSALIDFVPLPVPISNSQTTMAPPFTWDYLHNTYSRTIDGSTLLECNEKLFATLVSNPNWSFERNEALVDVIENGVKDVARDLKRIFENNGGAALFEQRFFPEEKLSHSDSILLDMFEASGKYSLGPPPKENNLSKLYDDIKCARVKEIILDHLSAAWYGLTYEDLKEIYDFLARC
jgi:hypothetical protein